MVSFYRLRGIAIGPGTFIHAGVQLKQGWLYGRKGRLIIEKNGRFSKGAIIKCYGGTVHIAENVFVGEYAVLYGHGGIEIGANSLIAMHVCIVSSNHTIPDRATTIRSQPDVLLPVTIGCDVWVGAGAKILGGVTIGDGCVIGAGAVVTRDIPPFAIATGNPAKIIRYRNG